MDQTALPPPGSLAARVAQARAQQQREAEQRAHVAAGHPRRVLGGAGQAGHGSHGAADRVRPTSEEVVSPAGDEASDALDSADELAGLRRAFATPETAADVEDLAPDPTAVAGHVSQVSGVPHSEQTEIAQLQAQVQRAEEELVSMRRRNEREKEELGHAARKEAIAHMLPVVDDLERALAHVPATLRDDPWVAGIIMIGDSVQRTLERQGVERIAPCHAPFDPRIHEAVSQIEATDVAEDTVVEVYRSGYTYYGQVLRAAQVQVAVRKAQR